MGKMVMQPPRTAMEVFKILPEGTLAEVIDNHLYMSPAPTGQHQRILQGIFVQIYQHVSKTKSGEVFVAPCDVFLDEAENAVQPDIFYIANTNVGIVEDSVGFHGSPDLIIEILSPGTRHYDMQKKKSLYETFGVKEYWLVDPASKVATGYTLNNRTYSIIEEKSGEMNSILLNRRFFF